MYTRGFPRNLGDAVVSVLESGGHPLNKPRPAAVALVAEGANREREHGTAKRRQRSEAGRAAASRIFSLYLRSRGTPPSGPCGGKGKT